MKPVFLLVLIFGLLVPLTTSAEDIVRDIEFPVLGDSSYTSSFGDPRSGGRTHEGVDIFAAKMTPFVSAVDGVVSLITFTERDWGNGVFIRDGDGYSYRYLHVNNDTPGTDDGAGGSVYAFPGTIVRGTRVMRGQLIGWVGDSGNAEDTAPHLHFEIRTPDDTPLDPYQSLQAATKKGMFDPTAAGLRAPTINHDRDLTVTAGQPLLCSPGSLIKPFDSSAVYYCGADGKRYVFSSPGVYFSWYKDFSNVTVLGEAILAQIPLGGNVTYKPGSRMVKIETDPQTYVVDKGGVLRVVVNETIAESMYGTKWNTFIDDLSPTFFINYTLGEPITVPLER